MSPRWLVLVVAALLSLLGQSFVTQTHIHASGWSTGTAPAAGARLDTRHAPGDQPDKCPICRELAHAGQYLAAGPITSPFILPLVGWMFVLALRCQIRRHRIPGWRSRGPPSLLPA